MQLFYAIVLFFALAYKYGWTTACLAPAGYAAFLAYRLYHFGILMRKLKGIPIDGPYLLPPFSSILSLLLPPPFAPPKQRGIDPERERKTKWEVFQTTIYATVGILPVRGHVVIADVKTMQHIFADRITFPKALELYSMVKSSAKASSSLRATNGGNIEESLEVHSQTRPTSLIGKRRRAIPRLGWRILTRTPSTGWQLRKTPSTSACIWHWPSSAP